MVTNLRFCARGGGVAVDICKIPSAVLFHCAANKYSELPSRLQVLRLGEEKINFKWNKLELKELGSSEKSGYCYHIRHSESGPWHSAGVDNLPFPPPPPPLSSQEGLARTLSYEETILQADVDKPSRLECSEMSALQSHKTGNWSTDSFGLFCSGLTFALCSVQVITLLLLPQQQCSLTETASLLLIPPNNRESTKLHVMY